MQQVTNISINVNACWSPAAFQSISTSDAFLSLFKNNNFKICKWHFHNKLHTMDTTFVCVCVCACVRVDTHTVGPESISPYNFFFLVNFK